MTIITTPRTKEQVVVVKDFKDATLKVDYFWDSHGDLTNWNDLIKAPTFWPKANVQIRRYSFTENLLGKEFDFAMLQLVIDENIINGDILNYSVEVDENGTANLSCRLAIGWG